MIAKMAPRKLVLLAHGFSCILKIARTIADLEGLEDIAAYHISEAIQYRSPEWISL